MADQQQRTRGISFGHVLGARVVVQPATLVMLVILAFLLSSSGGSGVTRREFTVGLILAVCLVVSVFLHEVAHAVAARAFKREVHEIVLTLWGGHTSFDARALTPLVSGVVSLAGPVANLLISGSVALVVQFTGATGIAGAVAWWVVWANLLLAAFNSLPGIPMDGGRVLESVVWGVTKDRQRGTVVAAWAGRVVAVGVLVASIGVPFLRGGTPSLYTFVWAFIIFGLLWPAATAALNASKTISRMETIGARSLMVTAVGISYEATVLAARELAAHVNAEEVVVLSADGAAAGHFPVSLTDEVPPEERERTQLQSVTMPMPRGAVVDAALMGNEFIVHLREWWGKTEVWVVTERGQIIGVVRAADVLQALQ